MSDRTNISESELHAYIDGALDAEQRRAVEDAIAAAPALAEQIAAYRADKLMLKRIYGPLIDRPVPQEWLALARTPLQPERRRVSWRLVGSIAAAILVLLGMASYWGLRSTQSHEIVQIAMEARQNAFRADRVIAVEPNGRYDRELSEAVATRVHVPDLARMGYRLASIRIYANAPNGRAAELMYRDGENRLFTLYLSRSNGKERFDQFPRDGLRVCIWQDEVLSMVMAGDMSTAAMQRLASLTYNGLTS